MRTTIAAAFSLALRLDEVLDDDPLLDELWMKLAQTISVATEPEGADIYFRAYSAQEAEWESLGASPLQPTQAPFGLFWLKIERDGFQTIESLFPRRSTISSPTEDLSFQVTLNPTDAIPETMVRVPTGPLAVSLFAFDNVPVEASSYLMDKHEVTNADFKSFVDEGGYGTRELWRHEFRYREKRVSWEVAMRQFRDETGRPGPSTWEVGAYPEGRARYPVSGVSWFEGAAYCVFVGKRLPSIYHWLGATRTSMADAVISMSNFGGGPMAVAIHPPGPRGTYDMAGNVREWCSNEVGERRYILGGAANQPTFMFYESDVAFPMDRSSTNGFRCADFLDAGRTELDALMAPIELPVPPEKLEPVSDEVFEAYKALFDFDPVPLDSNVDSVDVSSPYWRREKITFRAAYAEEDVALYLFLPTSRDPPFQTVIYFPGVAAQRQSSPDKLQMRYVAFLIHSGRAVAYPIYKGTHERKEPIPEDMRSRAFVDYHTYWMSDLTRTVDYLETRDDIDTDKLGYYGFSWGGTIGAMVLALEQRFSAAVLLDGGLSPIPRRPEIRIGYYAPRVETPVLMINGSEDATFPLERSQKPLFDLLGTPAENKQHILFPAGHAVFSRFRNQAIGKILDWFDRYLGPTS
ncbi:MAG: hypothetical protein E2P02_03525 [Acidobacteria bacterium]|nr:MAG: hypothetical protein E2P02_03525 [Acidobacteriota bacterium]